MNQIGNENLTLLISESKLKQRIKSLVKRIAHDLRGNELVVIGLLRGSFMFLSDLARMLYLQDIPLIIDFMIVSSYGSQTKSSGNVKLIRDISVNIEGKNVLLIDDILDTGQTLNFVAKHLIDKKPALLKSCVFLNKTVPRTVDFKPDYVGFTVPDSFVVGYGLDYNGRYRELPHISILSFEGKNYMED